MLEPSADTPGEAIEELPATSADARALVPEQLNSDPLSMPAPAMRAADTALDQEHELAPTLQRLTFAVEELARVAEMRERHFAELHRDNQRMRGELDSHSALPIFRDLIMLFDQLRAAGHEDFADNVAIILDRYNVEVYEARPGDPFVPNLHRGAASVPTTDSAADKTVVRMLRPGFRLHGRTVRPAEVEVYRINSRSS